MITTIRGRCIIPMPDSTLLDTNAQVHCAFDPNSSGNNSLHFAITQTTSI